MKNIQTKKKGIAEYRNSNKNTIHLLAYQITRKNTTIEKNY